MRWGDDDYGQSSLVKEDRFTVVRSGHNDARGLRPDGCIHCQGVHSEYSQHPTDAWYTVIGSWTNQHTCAIRVGGAIDCWDYDSNSNGETSPPDDGNFIVVTSGEYHSCALREDGTAVCRGLNTIPTYEDWVGQASRPEGERFSPISAGGLRLDGTLACWGEATTPPSQN